MKLFYEVILLTSLYLQMVDYCLKKYVYAYIRLCINLSI